MAFGGVSMSDVFSFFSMGFLEKKGGYNWKQHEPTRSTYRMYQVKIFCDLDRFNSQKVGFWKGKLSYFGKTSRLVKYDNLARFMEAFCFGTF